MTESLNDSAILEALPEALLIARRERIVLANPAARHLLGAAGFELMGLDLGDIIHEADLSCLRRNIASDTGRHTSLRFRPRKRDGEAEVAVDCRASPLSRDEGAGNDTILLVLRDASEAVRAEELISHLAGLARQTGGISGTEAVLRAASPMFAELGWWAAFFQTHAEGALVEMLLPLENDGKGLMEFARRLQSAGLLSWSKMPTTYQAYRTGQPVFFDDIEAQMDRAGGYGLELLSHMQAQGFSKGAWVPVKPEGGTSHVLLVVGPSLTKHDFRAMQLLAEMLGAALRLESLQAEVVRSERLAAVGEMSRVLAHELRNPLAVIFNAVAGLRRSLSASEDQNGLLSIIHEEADHLKRVVRDLVDFAGPTAPEMRATNLAETVDMAVRSLAETRGASNVSLSMQMPSSLPSAHADPHLLQRALVDILDNAYEAVSDGGSIRVVGETTGEGWVRVRIRNDGEPLSPDEAVKVFQPFYTTRATGTGLGLTLVRRIVEDLGGKITVDPDDSGASFSVWLEAAGSTSHEEVED